MNRRVILILIALITLPLTGLFAPAGAAEVPPLPGQVRVVTFSDAAGCTDHVRIIYGLKTSDTPIGFQARKLANCTVALSVKEYGTSFAYVQGVHVTSQFNERDANYEGPTRFDSHEASISAVWPAINANAPCPGQTTWAASIFRDHPTFWGWDNVARPPTNAWATPQISDGVCTVTSTTGWEPYRRDDADLQNPGAVIDPPFRAFDTFISIDTTGVAECNTKKSPGTQYTQPDISDFRCYLNQTATVDTGPFPEPIRYIEAGSEATINVHS